MTTTQQTPLHPKTVSIYTNYVWDHFEQIPLIDSKNPRRLVKIVQHFIAHQKVPTSKISTNLGKRVAKLEDLMLDPDLPDEQENLYTFPPQTLEFML